MKKLLIFLFLAVISLSVFSQERTVTKKMREGYTYYKYSGVAADTLIYTNQDTIDIVFQVGFDERISKIEVKSKFDTIDGADTTVAISVYGKNFEDGTYAQMIASTLSSAVTTDDVVKVLSGAYTETHVTAAYNLTEAAYNGAVSAFDIPFTNPSAGTADTLEVPSFNVVNASHLVAVAEQTTTVTPVDYSYRFIRVRYIIQGDDSVGDGIKLDEVELKLFK